MKTVLVKASPIQGKGVFAARNFHRGEAILAIDDTHVVANEEELTEYQKQFECDWLGDRKTVFMQVPEKYINHSCDPNSYVKTVDGVRNVIAMCTIRSGEEITYDYAVNGYYDSNWPCRCGAQTCRKILNANFFKLPEETQKRYLPFLDDWFVEQFGQEIRQIDSR